MVFDADDTTLFTYDMEVGAMHFNYNPTLQDYWVQNKLFPATPAMVSLVNSVAKSGCTIAAPRGGGLPPARKIAALRGSSISVARYSLAKWL